MLGLCIFNAKLMDVFFIKPFYKSILNLACELQDLESFDPEHYKSLVWMQVRLVGIWLPFFGGGGGARGRRWIPGLFV